MANKAYILIILECSSSDRALSMHAHPYELIPIKVFQVIRSTSLNGSVWGGRGEGIGGGGGGVPGRGRGPAWEEGLVG